VRGRMPVPPSELCRVGRWLRGRMLVRVELEVGPADAVGSDAGAGWMLVRGSVRVPHQTRCRVNRVSTRRSETRPLGRRAFSSFDARAASSCCGFFFFSVGESRCRCFRAQPAWSFRAGGKNRLPLSVRNRCRPCCFPLVLLVLSGGAPEASPGVAEVHGIGKCNGRLLPPALPISIARHASTKCCSKAQIRPNHICPPGN